MRKYKHRPLNTYSLAASERQILPAVLVSASTPQRQRQTLASPAALSPSPQAPAGARWLSRRSPWHLPWPHSDGTVRVPGLPRTPRGEDLSPLPPHWSKTCPVESRERAGLSEPRSHPATGFRPGLSASPRDSYGGDGAVFRRRPWAAPVPLQAPPFPSVLLLACTQPLSPAPRPDGWGLLLAFHWFRAICALLPERLRVPFQAFAPSPSRPTGLLAPLSR